jgi:hypothetical protein
LGAACGKGTAGASAPQVLEAIGCEIPPDTKLDHTQKYNRTGRSSSECLLRGKVG